MAAQVLVDQSMDLSIAGGSGFCAIRERQAVESMWSMERVPSAAGKPVLGA
jgi:hypothetical protein